MEQQLLPPWTKKRRLITGAVLTAYILSASLFIGAGVYQIGVNQGWLRRPFSKEQIASDLMNDAGFIRAVEKSTTTKHCLNQTLGFEYDYRPPLTLVEAEGEQKCGRLVTLHSTGADIVIDISKLEQSREAFVLDEVKRFDRVDTQMLSGIDYPTSRLIGVYRGIMTEMYIIGIDRYSAYLVRYAPTDPTITDNVLALVESFYSIPQ